MSFVPPSSRSVRSVVVAFVALLALLASPIARAQGEASQVTKLLANAAPEVRAELDISSRSALHTLVASGKISNEQLGNALRKPNFAPVARTTLRALAKVDGVEGVPETFGRLVSAGNPGGVVGPAFEIEVAAAFGADMVRGVGVMVDGDEVDLMLVDGTRVEAKSFPENDRKLTRKMTEKATKQLALRGRFADKVMMVTNQPLEAKSLEAFRQQTGPSSKVVVLQNGALNLQLDHAKEGGAAKFTRLTLGKMRRVAHNSKAGFLKAMAPVTKGYRTTKKWIKKHTPKAMAKRMQHGGRAFVRVR